MLALLFILRIHLLFLFLKLGMRTERPQRVEHEIRTGSCHQRPHRAAQPDGRRVQEDPRDPRAGAEYDPWQSPRWCGVRQESAYPSFQIGRLSNNYVKVSVLRRCYPECEDYWDGNWIDVKVEVSAGGFRGGCRAYLRADEFFGFRKQLGELQSSLKGEACFDSMESWLNIKVNGDDLGHFTADCEAMDEAGIGNTLQFSLKFDQTDIPEILARLDEILGKFPVVGAQEDNIHHNEK